jgi:hypothetical protein
VNNTTLFANKSEEQKPLPTKSSKSELNRKYQPINVLPLNYRPIGEKSATSNPPTRKQGFVSVIASARHARLVESVVGIDSGALLYRLLHILEVGLNQRWRHFILQLRELL